LIRFYGNNLILACQVNQLKRFTMKQFLKTALLILVLVLFSVTVSTAQDKITLNNGTTISGDIVSMDTNEIKLKYYPQIDKTRWV
jgi:hypothetical protein